MLNYAVRLLPYLCSIGTFPSFSQTPLQASFLHETLWIAFSICTPTSNNRSHIYIYLYLQEGSTGSPNAFPTSLAVGGSCDRGIAHLSRVDHRSMITISVTFQHRPVVEMQQYLARIWDHPPPRTQYPALQPTDGIRQPVFSCGFCTT